jgi:hypothetical protein
MKERVNILIFLISIPVLLNGQVINRQNYNTTNIATSLIGKQYLFLTNYKNQPPSLVSLDALYNTRGENKEIAYHFENADNFFIPNQLFRYGAKLTQHFNYPIMHTSPSASVYIQDHNIYLGPEFNLLLTKPKVDTTENWKPDHVGVNIGYRYILKSERKKTNLFLQMNFSFYQVKYKEYKSGSTNTIDHQKMIIENTGSMGINYKFTKKLEIYGGVGFGSTCGFFLLFKKFIPHSFFGVGYTIN